MAMLLALATLAPAHAASQAADGVSPDRASASIASGIELYRNKDAAAAKLKFSAAIRANPHSADALTWRGIAENQLKQYAEAVKDFQAALRLDPNETSAHYNLALSLIRLNQTDAAIDELKIVTTAHPGVVEPEYNLAVLLEAKKATAEAVEHLQAARQTDPNDTGIARHLVFDLLALDRANEAQPILEQLRDQLRSANSSEIARQIGAELVEAGHFQQAVLLLEGADPTNREGRLLLARAYIGAADYDQAIALLTPQRTVDETGECAYLLGLAYSAAGDAPEAEKAFNEAVQTNPRNAQALYHLGMLQADVPERQAQALHCLREATLLEPGNAAYAFALGRLLLQEDQAAEALAALQRIHPAGREAAERDLLLGIAQTSTGAAAQAIPTLERAIAADPSLALSYNILGFCYFNQGDFAKAAKAYRQASDLRPEIGLFAHDAAIALDRSNDTANALVYAQRAVSLPNADGDDHYLIGKLLAKQNHKEEAIPELKVAVQLSPDLDAAYYALARAYMQTGDMAQATEWNARLNELKQKHDRTYAAETKSKQVRSSTLLRGAPMSGAESEGP
jgi:tetratricopeptide (TPR) repeat protein